MASQEGYRGRRDEGKDSALRKAATRGEQKLLERQLKKRKQRGRREWGERDVMEAS